MDGRDEMQDREYETEAFAKVMTKGRDTLT